MIHVIPITTESIDLGERATGFFGQVGFLATEMPDEGCAM